MGRRGEIGKRGRGTCSWGNKSTQQQHLIKAEDAQHIAVVMRWGMERGRGKRDNARMESRGTNSLSNT